MSTATRKYPTLARHDNDFYTWAIETARAIREGRLEAVDWEAVAEELEDMGRSERRELESRLEVLLAHLLKWRYQPEQHSSSWTGTIKEQRRKAERLLRENPGLKSMIVETIADAYHSALAIAERETGINEAAFPKACPWDADQVLDEGFWPEPHE